MSEVSERAGGRSHTADAAPEVDLELPAGSFGAVGRLVLAGMASRAGVTVDRIDELQLALDTLLRRPVAGDTVSLRMRPGPESLTVRVGPFRVEDGERADLERVLDALVDEVVAHDVESDLWLDLGVSLRPTAPAS